MLAELAQSYGYFIQAEAAEHPNISIDTLEKLAIADNPLAHIAIIKNPKTPKKTLEKLANHQNFMTRIFAEQKLNEQNKKTL